MISSKHPKSAFSRKHSNKFFKLDTIEFFPGGSHYFLYFSAEFVLWSGFVS
jgi:hypothetical protein